MKKIINSVILYLLCLSIGLVADEYTFSEAVGKAHIISLNSNTIANLTEESEKIEYSEYSYFEYYTFTLDKKTYVKINVPMYDKDLVFREPNINNELIEPVDYNLDANITLYLLDKDGDRARYVTYCAMDGCHIVGIKGELEAGTYLIKVIGRIEHSLEFSIKVGDDFYAWLIAINNVIL